jgi:hypothetical protein
MKKIIFPLVTLLFSQLAASQCEEVFSVPYTAPVEEVTVPNLPECISSNYSTFASQEIFKSIEGPVEGFTGKVFAYSTATTSQESFVSYVGAGLYINNIQLEAGVPYRVSYKYGISDPSKLMDWMQTRIQDPMNNVYINVAFHDNITGGSIANVVSDIFNVPATGTYSLTFELSSAEKQGFFYLDDITIEEGSAMGGPLGLGENSISEVSVYPNPTSQKLIINDYNQQFDKFDVYSLTGQKLLSEPVTTTLHEIDMANFSTGMYILHLHSGGDIKKIKVYKD